MASEEHATSVTSRQMVAGCVERAYARADAIDAMAAELFPKGQSINSDYPRALQALASQIRSDVSPVAIALVTKHPETPIERIPLVLKDCICPDDNTRAGNCPRHAPVTPNTLDIRDGIRYG